jgi:homoserine O-acetyltransferase
VPGIHRLTFQPRRALRTPQRHRVELRVHHAAAAPQHQRVAGDALASRARCTVLAILPAHSADLFRLAGALTNAAKRGHRPPGARLAGGAGFCHSWAIGLVTPQQMHFSEPLPLKSGATLPTTRWPTKPTARSMPRAATPCWCATRSTPATTWPARHADGSVGWWDNLVGPGKPLDTNRFFVIGVNNPGSCFGSTGPMHVNPATGARLRRGLPGGDGGGLGRRAGAAGAAPGHRRSWPPCWAAAWAACRRWPGRCATRRAAPLRGGGHRAQPVGAEHRLQRSGAPRHRHRPRLPRRPLLRHGVVPKRGLRVARMIGHITYLSDDAMEAKFGRELKAAELGYSTQEIEFQIESYLRHQGDKFSEYFDANTYLLITRALDYFDPAREHGGDLARPSRWRAQALPAGQLHHRLALFAGALARDRQGAGRQPHRRQLRRDRRTARPRRLPAGRPALPPRDARLLSTAWRRK